MSQLRCEKCGKLWSWEGTSVTPEDRCGVRLSSDVWCDGTLVEHQCGGPREACGLRGCEECGGESLTSIAELRITVEQLTRERDEARARVAELTGELVCAESRRAELEEVKESLDEDVASLNGIVERLSAPPVVPEGWWVEWRDRMWQLRDTVPDRDIQWPPAALEALAYARRTGKRPPHAGDKP